MSSKITRAAYADMFGPTTGDKVRLADTDLIVEVEKDFTVYGDEVWDPVTKRLFECTMARQGLLDAPPSRGMTD